jgi:uncharacterized membrane protein
MKAIRFMAVLVLLLMAVLPFTLAGMAAAQDETTTPPPTTTTTTTPPPMMKMTTDYPKLEAIATGTFTFAVALSYTGDTARVFDLNTTGPAGWDISITPQYDTQRISSISMDASAYAPTTKTLKLTITPQMYPLPDPGDYTITLHATSGDVSGRIDLIARITAKYALNVLPYSQVYNTKAQAGRDNTYSLVITNTGTAAIENIAFSSEKPEGWEITFKPSKIDLLNTLDQNTVDVDIKPPPKTVAGDYMVTLHVAGTQATADKMDVRVTVQTPTIWGWVGVIIIVVVVAGLIVVFMRFGRR